MTDEDRGMTMLQPPKRRDSPTDLPTVPVQPALGTNTRIEQMRVGTIKVREALGTSVNVTDVQIQEALWHYYYDIGKSATYLKSTAYNRLDMHRH